jgi:phage gpG-like protein
MKMNMPARPYMAPSVAENREKITGDVRKALVEALK